MPKRSKYLAATQATEEDILIRGRDGKILQRGTVTERMRIGGDSLYDAITDQVDAQRRYSSYWKETYYQRPRIWNS